MAGKSRSEAQPALTEAEADHQVERLRRLYAEGHLSREGFETMAERLLLRAQESRREP